MKNAPCKMYVYVDAFDMTALSIDYVITLTGGTPSGGR